MPGTKPVCYTANWNHATHLTQFSLPLWQQNGEFTWHRHLSKSDQIKTRFCLAANLNHHPIRDSRETAISTLFFNEVLSQQTAPSEPQFHQIKSFCHNSCQEEINK